MSMFAVISTYKKSLDEVDKKREEHLAYVKNFILSGKFLVVGRKNPVDGAVIIAHNLTKKELEELLLLLKDKGEKECFSYLRKEVKRRRKEKDFF